MASSRAVDDWLVLDGALRVGVQRTLRVPDDGNTYPLPPALGRLPVRAVTEYPQLPPSWQDGSHFIAPVHHHEAAWLQFNARPHDARALKIGAGNIDALTGAPWDEHLRSDPQNYIVCPYQPWLDGFKVAPGVVRQFVAVGVFEGTSVESQLGHAEAGGFRLAGFAPKAGWSPPPVAPESTRRALAVGAGGRIKQRVYPDPYGFDVWESTPTGRAWLHLVSPEDFAAITGEPAPPSPVNADTYTRFGLPWFEVYDAARGELSATSDLASVASVEDIGGKDASSPASVPVPPDQVRPIPPRSRNRRRSE